MHEWGWEWNSYCTVSIPHPPPQALFIEQNIPENTTCSPGIYGLYQCLSHRAKSSCRKPGIVPSGLDQTEQDGHNSTCSGLSLSLPDLNQYMFVCSQQTYVATSCSQRFSVSPWSWVWSGWKETGRKNEVSRHGTVSGLGNQGLRATAQCQCFMAHLLCF